jgi:hypothetical protein
MDLALLTCGARFIVGTAPERANEGTLGLAEAGGVIRETVGREVMAFDGRAAGKPAFGPRTLARVGDTSGFPMLEMLCSALGDVLAAVWATDKPRSRVFLGTAVRALGLFA